MNADLLAAKVRYGYGKAASILGRTATVYRPDETNWNAVTVTQRPAVFDTVPTFTLVNPQKFGAAVFYALMDATDMAIGDYVVGSDGVRYFVTTLDDVPAPMVIRCNRLVTVARPGLGGSPVYGGTVIDTPLFTWWPAAIQQGGGRAETGPTGLPGDTRMPGWTVFLPASIPAQVRNSDRITDDQPAPVSLLVSGAEQTAMGWRCIAVQTGA